MLFSTTDFAINVTTPVLVLLAAGYWLFKQRFLTEEFVATGAKLVFNIALPALLFTSISQANFAKVIAPEAILIGVFGTLFYFFLLVAFTHFSVSKHEHRGVVVQGGFRANMAIIGLAYCANMFGQEGLAAGAIYIGFVTISYNVLSVLVLNHYIPGKTSIAAHVKGIATNPLIIAIVAALPFSFWQIELPQVVIRSAGYFAQLTLPLALLCTGASLQFRNIGNTASGLIVAVASKTIVYPAVMIALAVYFAVSPLHVAIIFLMSIAPTAAASYVMVRNIGGDYRLAANIIALTTLLSLPITIVGFTILTRLEVIATP